MKQIALAFTLLFLVGCGTTAEKPPVISDTPLEKTDVPVATVDKIILDEWFDYGCHFCEESHGVIKKLKEKYGDQLEVREHHFPLSAATFVFAEASECARDQGKFDEFHDEVFTYYYGKYDVSNITKIAKSVEIPDLDRFNTCITSGGEKDKVTADIREAEKIGVSGTPFFRINKELNIPGAISEKSFISLFDELLTGEK